MNFIELDRAHICTIKGRFLVSGESDGYVYIESIVTPDGEDSQCKVPELLSKTALPGVHKKLLACGVNYVDVVRFGARYLVISAGEDGVIYCRVLKVTRTSYEVMQTIVLEGHTDSIDSICTYSQRQQKGRPVVDSIFIVSASNDGDLRVWRVKISSTQDTLVGELLSIASHRTTMNNVRDTVLVPASKDSYTVSLNVGDRIKVWSISASTGGIKRIRSLNVRGSKPSAMASLSPNGMITKLAREQGMLIVGYSNGKILLWDTVHARILNDKSVIDMGSPFAVTTIRPLSRLESGDITVPGTTLVISGNQEGRVEAWEINTFCGTVPLDHLGSHSPRYHPLEKETYTVIYDSITAITTVPSQVFPGAMSFVTGSANGSVKVWGVDKCTLREVDDQTIFEFEDIPTAKPVRSLLTVGKTIIAGVTRV